MARRTLGVGVPIVGRKILAARGDLGDLGDVGVSLSWSAMGEEGACGFEFSDLPFDREVDGSLFSLELGVGEAAPLFFGLKLRRDFACESLSFASAALAATCACRWG